MKKILFFSLLAGMALAGCTNDELVNGSVFGGDNDCIGFVYNSSNMTRGNEKLQNTHYEFGVFADNGEPVMDNYLVAYGDNALYQTLKNGSTTFGDPNSQVDGLSYWFYETLSSTNGTTYNKAENTQILKFWDKSKDNYYFWAYAPYTKEAAADLTNNAEQVTFDKSTNAFTFANLSSFYTTPVVDEAGTAKKQVTTADAEAANALTNYDAEMVNYNEGLYAYKLWPKANYGNDVPFEFKHINAKVKLAFYDAIEGYKVQLMDLIPQDMAAGTNKFALSKTTGIVLNPANTYQSIYYDNETTHKYLKQTETANLVKYYGQTQVSVTGIDGTPTISVGQSDVNDSISTSLYFQPTNATGASVNGETQYIGESSSAATTSATTLYVLPNWDGSGSAYITPASTVAGNISQSTGYTLHVSYMLIPEDGSAKMKIYDARVYIPAEYCKWEAGKAYTYVFKITKNANGTTDPQNEIDKFTDDDDPSTDEEPYVDPSDPRVPDDAALQPIVFDGLTVADYDETTVSPEFVITDATLSTAFAKALASIKTQFSNGGPKATTISATGTGATSSDPFVVNYTVKVSDFKWEEWNETAGWDLTDPSYTDVNNSKVCKDLQALFQAMYNQSGITKINYIIDNENSAIGWTDGDGAKDFVKSNQGLATPPGWFITNTPAAGNRPIENHIGSDLFMSFGEVAGIKTPAAGDKTVEFSIFDSKGNQSFVKLNITIVAD